MLRIEILLRIKALLRIVALLRMEAVMRVALRLCHVGRPLIHAHSRMEVTEWQPMAERGVKQCQTTRLLLLERLVIGVVLRLWRGPGQDWLLEAGHVESTLESLGVEIIDVGKIDKSRKNMGKGRIMGASLWHCVEWLRGVYERGDGIDGESRMAHSTFHCLTARPSRMQDG